MQYVSRALHRQMLGMLYVRHVFQKNRSLHIHTCFQCVCVVPVFVVCQPQYTHICFNARVAAQSRRYVYRNIGI